MLQLACFAWVKEPVAGPFLYHMPKNAPKMPQTKNGPCLGSPPATPRRFVVSNPQKCQQTP